jgi:hypothetical protein
LKRQDAKNAKKGNTLDVFLTALAFGGSILFMMPANDRRLEPRWLLQHSRPPVLASGSWPNVSSAPFGSARS